MGKRDCEEVKTSKIGGHMETLELDIKQVRILKKKAYEWRAKINKRNNRLDYFKTTHAIERFKQYIKSDQEKKFIPNKTEILQAISWFMRCPARDDNEKMVFTLIGLTYKLHRYKLTNIKKDK
jgi:hypothetical protein